MSTFRPGDVVKVLRTRRWYDGNGHVQVESDDGDIGKVGTVVENLGLQTKGNVPVKFAPDDAMVYGFMPSCLALANPLDEAKQGVYQPAAQDHHHPTPLPPSMLEVTGMHEDDAGIVVTWSHTDAIVEAKRQAAMAEELREQAVKELAEFKEQVAAVARRYAVEHDWCDTVEQALAEVGIEPEKNRVRFSLTLELNVTADLTNPSPSRRDSVNEEYIRDSFRSGELRDAVAKAMDSDWADVRVELTEHSVDWDGWIK